MLNPQVAYGVHSLLQLQPAPLDLFLLRRRDDEERPYWSLGELLMVPSLAIR